MLKIGVAPIIGKLNDFLSCAFLEKPYKFFSIKFKMVVVV